MARYEVIVRSMIEERGAIWLDADSQEDANSIIEAKLEHGWSEVFGDSDGDLIDVQNEVIS